MDISFAKQRKTVEMQSSKRSLGSPTSDGKISVTRDRRECSDAKSEAAKMRRGRLQLSPISDIARLVYLLHCNSQIVLANG